MERDPDAFDTLLHRYFKDIPGLPNAGCTPLETVMQAAQAGEWPPEWDAHVGECARCRRNLYLMTPRTSAAPLAYRTARSHEALPEEIRVGGTVVPRFASQDEGSTGFRRRPTPWARLVEVAAVIATLLAILIPVLASVRSSGMRSLCASNARQIGLAVHQYLADYDGRFPIPMVNGPNVSWAGAIQPYLKSTMVLHCPTMTDVNIGGLTIWGANSPSPSNRFLYSGYGWNVDFLAPAKPDRSDYNTQCIKSGLPRRIDGLNESGLVMCVGISMAAGPGSVGGISPIQPVGSGYCLAPAPATVGQPDEVGTQPSAGWGLGSYLGPYGGFEAPRHGGRGQVLFVDGHVRSLTPEQLAAGTNWSPTKKSTEIRVTDPSRYMWHPR